MKLVHDCLDKQVVDKNGRKVGRVDGLVIHVSPGHQPKVAYIELGSVTQAARLHARLGRWALAIARRWGRAKSNPYRIPWARIGAIGENVEIALSAEATPGFAWERWLRQHVVRRIPGA
jgi:sporulation protein YlmC with PRC-barrel domain